MQNIYLQYMNIHLKILLITLIHSACQNWRKQTISKSCKWGFLASSGFHKLIYKQYIVHANNISHYTLSLQKEGGGECV